MRSDFSLNSPGERISKDTSGRLAYVGEISPRIASVRSNAGEISESSSPQRQRETSMATNPRENSQGGSSSRDKYEGETSPTIIEIQAEMVIKHLHIQESLHSFPGSVPSGPHNGLVRKPLYQEDTCYRPEHMTSHQKQSTILELNRIWEDIKYLLADTTISIEDKKNIVLMMARTGIELVLLDDGRVGDVATGIDGTLVLPPLNADDVKHHFGEVKEFRSSYNQRFQRKE